MAPDYGLFAAAADHSDDSLAALAALVPEDGEVAVVETDGAPSVPGVAAVSQMQLCQMVAGTLAPAEAAPFDVEDLGEADAPEMLSLATLTRPGPFFAHTHRLGAFVGVRREGRLVAMAGERLKPLGFTEVSAVCTHPDHRGRGYGGVLTRVIAGRIQARGETPFLHVFPDNKGAIAIYEALGFALRKQLTVTILSRRP